MRCGRMRCGDIWRCGGPVKKHVPVEGVEIEGWESSMTFQGQPEPYYLEFSLSVTPSDATNKHVTITSSNPSVMNRAVYDETGGSFTVEREGETTITVTSQDNPEISVSYSVTVSAPFVPNNSMYLANVAPKSKTRSSAHDGYEIRFFARSFQDTDYVAAKLGVNDKLVYISYNGACAGNSYCINMFSDEDIKTKLGAQIGTYIDTYGVPLDNTLEFTEDMYEAIEDYFDGDGSIGDIVEVIDEEPIIPTPEFTVGIASNNVNYGTVSQASVTAEYGTQVSTSGNTLTIGQTTITATANNGYEFTSWQNVPETVTQDTNITANFTAIPTYTVSFTTDGNGTVDTNSVTVLRGTTFTTNGNELTIGSTTVTATPYESFEFDSWSVASSGTINSNTTIYAYFQYVEPASGITITNQYIETPDGTTPGRVAIDFDAINLMGMPVATLTDQEDGGDIIKMNVEGGSGDYGMVANCKVFNPGTYDLLIYDEMDPETNATAEIEIEGTGSGPWDNTILVPFVDTPEGPSGRSVAVLWNQYTGNYVSFLRPNDPMQNLQFVGLEGSKYDNNSNLEWLFNGGEYNSHYPELMQMLTNYVDEGIATAGEVGEHVRGKFTDEIWEIMWTFLMSDGGQEAKDEFNMAWDELMPDYVAEDNQNDPYPVIDYWYDTDPEIEPVAGGKVIRAPLYSDGPNEILFNFTNEYQQELYDIEVVPENLMYENSFQIDIIDYDKIIAIAYMNEGGIMPSDGEIVKFYVVRDSNKALTQFVIEGQFINVIPADAVEVAEHQDAMIMVGKELTYNTGGGPSTPVDIYYLPDYAEPVDHCFEYGSLDGDELSFSITELTSDREDWGKCRMLVSGDIDASVPESHTIAIHTLHSQEILFPFTVYPNKIDQYRNTLSRQSFSNYRNTYRGMSTGQSVTGNYFGLNNVTVEKKADDNKLYITKTDSGQMTDGYVINGTIEYKFIVTLKTSSYDLDVVSAEVVQPVSS